MNGTPQQWIDYLADVQHDRFGKSEKVLCPMLDRPTGLCQVHAFRNSVCSTFFCLKDHGSIGDSFWGKVQTLGSQVETALVQWALREAGFDMEAYIKRFNRLSSRVRHSADAATGGWLPEIQQELWGDWADRKIDLFLATAQLVSTHRESLWDIANGQDIVEASKFDQAMVRMVPKELEDQVDDGDWEEGGETVYPRELWRRCFQTYQRLWSLNFGSYQWAKRVKIRENSHQSSEEIYYQQQPYYIEFRTNSRSAEVEGRRFITAQEKDLLDEFVDGAILGWELLSQEKIKAHPDARGFFAEMIASRVLIKTPG